MLIKSYYLIDTDPTKWRKNTVILGKNILSNAGVEFGDRARLPPNFTIGDAPVSIDCTMLAHLLYFAGSPDVEVDSYAIDRIFSTSTILILATITLRATSDDRVDVLINHSKLRTIDDDESSGNLMNLKPIQDAA
ncbi:hypothetical protein BGX26_001271 [Mortierella sp. AD094]|nr:hypothetical protein BGX26_001271 [Mortierella sp. AD094]